MTPPIWLDAAGRDPGLLWPRGGTHAVPGCGGALPRTLRIPDWCDGSTEYPIPVDG